MKKVLAICLALVMLCGATGIAFAADSGQPIEAEAEPRIIYNISKTATSYEVPGATIKFKFNLTCIEDITVASGLKIQDVDFVGVVDKPSTIAISNVKITKREYSTNRQSVSIDYSYTAKGIGSERSYPDSATFVLE